MAIEFKTEKISGRFPEIWRGECKMLPGGFKPNNEFPVGTIIRRATLLCVDFETMSANVCKTAQVLAGGTTKAVRVPKGSYLTVGDNVAVYGGTAAPVAISSIDTKSSDVYDTINLASAITGIKEKDILIEAVAGEGEDAKVAPRFTPNMIVGEDKEFTGKGLPTLDAAFEAVVLTPSLNFPVLPEWKTGVALKDNPNIIFIHQ